MSSLTPSTIDNAQRPTFERVFVMSVFDLLAQFLDHRDKRVAFFHLSRSISSRLVPHTFRHNTLALTLEKHARIEEQSRRQKIEAQLKYADSVARLDFAFGPFDSGEPLSSILIQAMSRA